MGTLDAAIVQTPVNNVPVPPVSTPMQDAGIPTTTLTSDAGMTGGPMMPAAADAGRDAGPIVITIPTRSVKCGGTDCTTTNNRTCCDVWNRDTGFMGQPTCSTAAACTNDHPLFGDTNRAVLNDCDEPSDCGADQICCFVRYGMPISADLFSPDLVGPGGSRLCLELSACNAGMTMFSGTAGIPLGVVACKTAADCPQGSQCVPEQANSATTGKGGAARAGVMLCK